MGSALDRDEGLAAMQEAACQIASFSDSSRFLVVLRAGQRAVLDGCENTFLPGRVVEQPADRGTAPELFLAASYIKAEDPDAILVTIPSDSLPIRPHIFQMHLQEAVTSVRTQEDSLVLLATSATRPDPDLSWIEAGEPGDAVCSGRLRPVRRYFERATRLEAERFFRRGFLADTRVMVSRVGTLWRVGLDLFPAMMSRFEDLTDLLRLVLDRKVSPEIEQLALRDVYRGLEFLNFGRRILNQAPHELRVLPIRTTGADWGHAAIEETSTEDSVPAPPLAVSS
jgi:mannose-1-phosphate guanylyltransferase